ncbi:MAG: threonyl-tRNA synthetase editing domain-containing protein [archaeon]|nr:threonyl-tRNA synthetase editing domain-containing protein [archaeon]MCP8320366.1 threonyl-tRNA synthetase editing domain-containing protein [archaeon]
MKLLMFNTKEFWYKTFSKTVESVEDLMKEDKWEDALVIFLNVEKEDEEKPNKVLMKAVDNISWLARKVEGRKIVLHSFTHLSESKSTIEFAEKIIKDIRERLQVKGYEAYTTPFGYLLEFKIHVLGDSLAKVWKDI